MIKLFFLFLALSITGYIASFLSNNPGEIIIEWYGWLIKSSVSVIILITLISIIFIFYLIKAIVNLFKIPKRIKNKLIANKQKKGVSALHSGISALIMNEKDLAELHYRKTRSILNENPLKLVLELGISKSEKISNLKQSILDKMLSHPETRLLALKNSIDYSLKNNDIEKSAKLSELIPRNKDTPRWFYEKLLMVKVNQNNWQEVFTILKLMYKFGKITNKERMDLTGKLYYIQSQYNKSKSNTNLSLKNITLSLKHITDFPPAIAAKANLLYQKDSIKGQKYAEELWKKVPNPDLLNFLLNINKNHTALKILNYISGISKNNKVDFYINVTIAQLAIEAQAWPKAKSFLEKIPKENWTKNTYIMMAKIERMGHGNIQMSNLWLKESENAENDLCWGCMMCSYTSEVWHFICPKCSSLNKMKWDKFLTVKIKKIPVEITRNKNLKEIIHKKNPEDAARGILDELRGGVDR